jgi:hypothetical protein
MPEIDGKMVFSEFINLIQEGKTFFIKLKYFKPDLSSWEEMEKNTPNLDWCKLEKMNSGSVN